MGVDDAKTWNETWRKTSSDFSRPRWHFIFRRIARHVEFLQADVLELGCGEGNLGHWALKAGARHVTLVDFSDEALARARRLLNAWEKDKLALVKANLLEVDLGSRFDIVISSGVVEHFAGDDLARAVQRHAAHSRRYVAICIPSDTPFNRRAARDPRNRALFGFWQTIADAELAGLLSDQGFDIRVCERFRRSYGLTLLQIKGTRRVQAWLHRILFDFLFAPVLPRSLGGLLLVVGERRLSVQTEKDKQAAD